MVLTTLSHSWWQIFMFGHCSLVYHVYGGGNGRL